MNKQAPLQDMTENAYLSAGNSLASLDATQFLARFEAKEVTALDYVRACFDRIEQFNGDLHAFKCFDRSLAEERARRIDAMAAAGQPQAAMAGVPVGVKDIFNTYEFPTGMGTRILEDYMPGNDARVVSNIRLEGGIVAGKTVTAEFAVHTAGPTRNPYDPVRTPGTSSSGSAAAVASFMVPVALGTQTAGSIIRPASYCGVYGYKPSFGLIPRTAMLKTTDTLDTVGYLARSVADLALVFEVTRVRGHNYPVSEAALADPERRAPVGRKWRIGLLTGPKSSAEASVVKTGMDQLSRKLAAAGCDVFEYRLPEEFSESHHIHDTLYQRSLAYYFRYEWATHSEKFSPRLRDMIEKGLSIPPEHYQQALEKQSQLIHHFDRIATQFDVLVCPSTADEAPLGLDADDIVDHCLIWTLVGAPSMSLPLLTGTTGKPVGCQIVTRRFADYRLLAFARLMSEELVR